MRNYSIRMYVIALLFGVILTACNSVAITRHYVLNSVANAPEEQAKADTFRVGISSLILPSYLDRSRIVTRSSSNQLKLAEFDRWGGSLRKNITQVLLNNLSSQLEPSHITIIPVNSDVSPNISIEVELSRFEQFPDGKVYLSGMWQIVDSSGTLLTTNTADFSRRVAGKGYAATVKTMSILLGDLSRKLSESVTLIHARKQAW